MGFWEWAGWICIGVPLAIFALYLAVRVAAYAWRSGEEQFEKDRRKLNGHSKPWRQ